jgi:hypothetical protein
VPDYTVALTEPVPGRLAGELAKRVYFVAEEIDAFELVADGGTGGGRVTALRVTSREPLAPDDLRRKLDRLVANDILPQRNVRASEAWRSPHAGPVVPGVFDEMLARGIVTSVGEGQMAFAPPLTDLLAGFDTWVRRLAVEAVGAEDRRYPTLIPTAVLARSGYLRSFPQFLLVAGRLRGDLDTYESFLADLHDGAAAALQRHTTHAGYVLSPAVCYHAYQQLADTELASPLLAVTACTTCYRHESRYHHTLARLW